MSAWIGYLGPANAGELRGVLGAGAQSDAGDNGTSHDTRCYSREGFGLGITGGAGEPAELATGPPGTVTARVGSDAEAGCSASFNFKFDGNSDPNGTTITLACDPFGFHEVFIARVGSVLWFASDLRLMQRHPDIPKVLSPQAIHGYLCFSYVPTPLAIVDGIEKLPSGSRRRFCASGEGRSDGSANWHEHQHQNIDQEEAVITLRGLLRDSVARRLGDEREVGVFLSGGLDSSLIAALLVDLGVKVHLYTLDFGPPFDGELPVAKQVATHLGRELNIVPAHPAQIEAALAPTAAALSQPFGDGVTVPIFLLGQEAAGRAGTIFNGEGGDQLLGGWTSKPMIAAELYGGTGYDREQAYLNTYHRFFGLTDQMYTEQAHRMAGPADPGHWVRDALNAEGFSTLLHRLRAVNLWLKGAQNILPRATLLADAHGLRVHSPFFDRALTEWTFGLPSGLLLQGACEKYLLKKAAEPYLPPEVVWREKRGMGVPTTQWCLGPLKRELKRRLSPSRLKRDGWFNPATIKELRRGNDEPGQYRYRRVGEKLRALLMLHTWLDTREKPVSWPSSGSNGG